MPMHRSILEVRFGLSLFECAWGDNVCDDITEGQDLIALTATIDDISNLACPAGVFSEFHKDQGTQLLKTPHRHRNFTVKRLLLDAYQFVRAQSAVSKCFGRPFQPSRKYAEIDITYKCNLKCINCNRSCTQAPSGIEMPVADIEAFINQSIEKKSNGNVSEFWVGNRPCTNVFLTSSTDWSVIRVSIILL